MARRVLLLLLCFDCLKRFVSGTAATPSGKLSCQSCRSLKDLQLKKGRAILKILSSPRPDHIDYL